MRFEQRIDVKAGTAEVWEFLWDIERLARCVPGCQEVRELEPQRRYSLVLEERVGPFKAHFDMDVIVQEREPERMVRLQASGSDRKLGAFNRVGLEVKLEGTDTGGTALEVTADIQVVGRIASLGQVIIKRKAQEIVERFARAIAEELESVPSG